MNFAKDFPCRACIVLFCIACALLPAGCKRNDINLVKKSTHGNRERTIGMVFDTCSHFISTSWDRIQFEANRPIVVFTAEIPVQILLNTVSEDAGNWLSIERTYFKEVCPHLTGAYLRVTFPVAADKTFQLGEVMLGIASGKKTAWSPDFPAEEKEDIIHAIHADSPDIFLRIARYANPSYAEGSTLLHTLTGKDISRIQ
jgi:hypothetical protein